jgi:hypothetical protein
LNSLVERSGALGSIQKTGDDSMFRLQFDRLLTKWKAGGGSAPPVEASATPRKG